MQMSKNRPRVKARDGKCVRWNLFRRNKLKTVVNASCRTSLPFFWEGRVNLFRVRAVVGLTGLEPVTLRLSSACSNQLSYRPWIQIPSLWKGTRLSCPSAAVVEARGFEPLTYSLQSYRSTN